MNAIIAAIILAGTYVLTGIIRWAIIFKVIEIIAKTETDKKSGDKE